jgi:hypothetical protein
MIALSLAESRTGIVGIVLYYNSTTPTVMDSKTAPGHGARSRRRALESELAPGAADLHRVPQRSTSNSRKWGFRRAEKHPSHDVIPAMLQRLGRYPWMSYDQASVLPA